MAAQDEEYSEHDDGSNVLENLQFAAELQQKQKQGVRMLVPEHKVGGIIGRKGEFIKRICEETKVRIKILDGPQGTEERACFKRLVDINEALLSKWLRIFRSNKMIVWNQPESCVVEHRFKKSPSIPRIVVYENDYDKTKNSDVDSISSTS